MFSAPLIFFFKIAQTPLPTTTRATRTETNWGKCLPVCKYRFCLCPQISFKILLFDWQQTGLHIIVLLKHLRCIYNNYTVCFCSMIINNATTFNVNVFNKQFSFIRDSGCNKQWFILCVSKNLICILSKL